jgi:hypothetical protein
VMIGLAFSFFKVLRKEDLPAVEPRATVTIPDAPAPRPGIAGGS